MTGKRVGFGTVELSRILAGKPHAPVVYFARMGEYVKIGTSTNLKARMQGLYIPLTDVLAVVPGGKEVEDAYHKRFAANQVTDDFRKELFRLDWRLRFFLGLARGSVSAEDMGMPADLPVEQEVGTVWGLDGELRVIEGGGRGPWDLERVADIVNRMAYLDSLDAKQGIAGQCAFYWGATHEQCVAELAELREELRQDRPRLWFLSAESRGNWRAEMESLRRIQAHGDRAAVIRDLFSQAITVYGLKVPADSAPSRVV